MSIVGSKARRRRVSAKQIVIFSVVILGIALLATLVAIPPLVMGPMVNQHVAFQTLYGPEEYGLTAEKLVLQTDDGVNIVAFDVYRENPKAVVIFISGIHNPSVTAFFGHARMLQNHGYASILLEMRSHGDSEGDVISLGHAEWLDTKVVVEYTQARSKYKDVPIVVFGLSMGGATAINSIAQIPEIDGLISLSAYSSWPDVFADNMINMGAPKAYVALQRPFVALYSMIKYGVGTRHMTPIQQIKNLGDRPALLIHSQEDSQVPFTNFERLLKQAPPHVETWVREGDAHMIVNDYEEPRNDPEYAERIVGFLNRHFSSL